MLLEYWGADGERASMEIADIEVCIECGVQWDNTICVVSGGFFAGPSGWVCQECSETYCFRLNNMEW